MPLEKPQPQPQPEPNSAPIEATVQLRGRANLPKKRKRKQRQYLKADPVDAPEFLRQNGYVYFKRACDSSLCEALSSSLEQCISAQQEAGAEYQEVPVEHLDDEVAKELTAFQQHVLKDVLQPRLGQGATRPPQVPEEWTEIGQTLYGRVKRRHQFTAVHCDALNTVVERGLIKRDVEDPATFTPQNLPLYTYWVLLKPLLSSASSHLQLQPRSHVLDGIRVHLRGRGGLPVRVAPDGYRPRKSDFLGPEGCYEVGDVVVFHCLVQHQASVHTESTRCKKNTSSRKSSNNSSNNLNNLNNLNNSSNSNNSKVLQASTESNTRVSCDGRFLLEFDSRTWAPACCSRIDP